MFSLRADSDEAMLLRAELAAVMGRISARDQSHPVGISRLERAHAVISRVRVEQVGAWRD